jgi:hypothetical protein
MSNANHAHGAGKQPAKQPASRVAPPALAPAAPISAPQRLGANPRSTASPAQILSLQRTVGNRAVQRLLSEQSPSVASQPKPVAVQRTISAPVIQRTIGKNEDNDDVVRITDGQMFMVSDSREVDGKKYFDLLNVSGGKDLDNIAEDDADFDLRSVYEASKAKAALSSGHGGKASKSTHAPSKYEELDAYRGPPTSQEGARQQRILTACIGNCVIAGLPEKLVTRAAGRALDKCRGWDGGADFEYACLSTFATLLLEIPGVDRETIEACLAEDADSEILKGFASEKLAIEEDIFELEDETDKVNLMANKFLGAEVAGFKKLWRTSEPGQKRLIHSLMYTDPELQSLSEIGYLLEAIDLPKHRYGLGPQFSNWAAGSSDRPFFDWFNTAPTTEERPIKYFNEEERKAFQITVGPVIKTAANKPLVGDNIFVMSQAKLFYAGGKDRGAINVHHSSFLSGQAVASAGHLFTSEAGKLDKINLASGHYQPSRPHLARALAALKKQGVDLNQVLAVGGVEGDGVNAEEWLESYLNPKGEEKSKDELT